ncbi:MAG TPA: EamA family transporter [Candidatus Kapabacteria bacterium]|nr:EamA family transporter [Candidatus Kapabacteria bacterium]
MIYFLLVFQQLLASSTHIIGQDVGRAVDPSIVLLFRATIASAAFLLIIAVKGESLRTIERKDWLRLALLGLLNVPINQALFLEGLQHTSAANSALLYAMTPALVFLLTLFIHREAPTRWKILGIIMAFIGVAMIVFEKGAALTSDTTLGNLMIFAAVVAWALYTLIGKPLVEKYGALRTTGLNMAVGALIYLPIGLLTSDMSEVSVISAISWTEILYMAIMASVVNYFLWFYALGKLETSRVAIFQNLQPVMTTVLALLLGTATITTYFVVGGVMALIGVILVQLA